MITGGDGISNMVEVDLELASTIFRHDAASRNALRFAGRGDFRKQRIQIVQILKAVDSRPGRPALGARHPPLPRPRHFTGAVVEQVKLELNGHNRRQAERREATQHSGK